MHEILAARPKPLSAEYLRGFAGMTAEPVPEAVLLAARDRLVNIVVGEMPEAHRRFLVSFERGEPEWEVLGLAGISGLPAVQWRLRNLDTLTAARRAALVAELEALLYGDAR